MRLITTQNPLLAAPRVGRRLTTWWLALPLAAAFLLLSEWPYSLLRDGFGWPRFPDHPASAAETATWLVAYLVVRFAPLALIVVAWAYAYERRGPVTLGLHGTRAGRRYARGFVVGALAFAALTVLMGVTGSVIRDGAPGPEGMEALGPVLLTLVGWTVQGPAEELLARGWLLQSVSAALGPLPVSCSPLPHSLCSTSSTRDSPGCRCSTCS